MIWRVTLLVVAMLVVSVNADTTWMLIRTNIPSVGSPPDPPDPPPDLTPLAATTLPIEVLGPNGTIVETDMVVTNGNTADNIWIQAHNLSYEGKMEISVNGSEWIPMTDSNVTYPDRERGMYGMGGISDVLRFFFTIDGAFPMYNGTNRFAFRFVDNSESKTIGYRVLKFNARSGTTDLIHSSQFTYENPALWTPISSNPADIADGLDAWQNLTIVERGTNIVAKCADCHFDDGSDLKYFNFSDKSIIARSIFHNVPPARATNIASYIRSLSTPYVAAARPYNPVFQPGPGQYSVPAHEWPAGAGLDWVMETGTNSFTYWFPSGFSTNANDLAVNLHASEIPLCIPMPTWNQWLPKVHPLDQDYAFSSTNSYHTLWASTFKPGLASRSGVTAADWWNTQKAKWDQAGGAYSPPGQNPVWLRDQRHWRVIKTMYAMLWKQIQEYGSPSDGIFSAVPNGAEVSDRRWFHGEIFQLGPHKLGSDKDDRFYWESSQWYQVQLIVNDSNRRAWSIVPIDWGYLHALPQSAWNNPADFACYDVIALNVYKGIEAGFNGITIGTTHSFDPRKANTYRLDGQYFRPFMDAMPVEFRRAVVESIGWHWVGALEEWTPAQYNAAGWNASTAKGVDFRNLLDNNISYWGDIGVSSTILDRMQDVRDALFP